MSNIPVPIIDSGDYNYGAQFERDGKVYAIRHDTTEDGYQVDDDRDPDSYQVSLVELVWDGSKWKSGGFAELSDGRLVILGLLPARVDIFFNGDVLQAWGSFVDTINEFLAEGGAVDTAGFPVDGTVTEKIEWLLANTQNVGGRAVVTG